MSKRPSLVKLRSVVAFVVVLWPWASARADDPQKDARAAFVDGMALVDKAQWAEALTAFERAAKLRAHPVTTFNMAACERAMGRYIRARVLYMEALAGSADGAKLPESLSLIHI